MTQNELDTILAHQAAQGTAFYSLLKEIDMPEKSKRKVEILFAMTQGFAMRLLKDDVASDLEFPESVNRVCDELNAMDL